MSEPRPFWREPMMWLVIAIPAASVVAGIALLVIAIRSGGADSVAEPVRRTAQIQVADLGPDARAQALKLSALVRVAPGLVEVLPVAGDFDRTAPLQLLLHHPTVAVQDRTLTLTPTDTGWRLAADIDSSHDWKIELQPGDHGWRLQGRLPKRQLAAYLAPALARD